MSGSKYDQRAIAKVDEPEGNFGIRHVQGLECVENSSDNLSWVPRRGRNDPKVGLAIPSQETCRGSFSVASKPILASNYQVQNDCVSLRCLKSYILYFAFFIECRRHLWLFFNKLLNFIKIFVLRCSVKS